MQSLGAYSTRIRCGKCDEDIAGTIAGVASIASQSERDLFRNPFKLGWDQGSIGCDHDDDRAYITLPDRVLGNFTADVDTGNAKLFAGPIVALHEDPNRISTVLGTENARA